MKKKILLIAGAIIAVLLVAVLTSMVLFSREVAAIRIGSVDLSSIEDGVYLGEHKTRLVSAQVKVTVKNHQIASIEIMKHENGRGKPAEEIVDAVVRVQSLQVDAVSGATVSSKVILKAIESALTK